MPQVSLIQKHNDAGKRDEAVWLMDFQSSDFLTVSSTNIRALSVFVSCGKGVGEHAQWATVSLETLTHLSQSDDVNPQCAEVQDHVSGFKLSCRQRRMCRAPNSLFIFEQKHQWKSWLTQCHRGDYTRPKESFVSTVVQFTVSGTIVQILT